MSALFLLARLTMVIVIFLSAYLNAGASSVTLQDIVRSVDEIKYYHASLTTKLFRFKEDREGHEKTKKIDLKNYMEIKSAVFGRASDSLRIETQFEMTKFDTNIALILIYDGKSQWVEKKIMKFKNGKLDWQNITATKIDVSKVTLTQKNEPFKTFYGIKGIGLCGYKDLPGTLKEILKKYDFKLLSQESIDKRGCAIFSGMLKHHEKKEIWKDFANNFKNSFLGPESQTYEILEKNIEFCKLWVSRENTMIQAFSLGSADDATSIEVNIKYESINKNLPAKIFSYNPPAGVEVQDITENVLQIMLKKNSQ